MNMKNKDSRSFEMLLIETYRHIDHSQNLLEQLIDHIGHSPQLISHLPDDIQELVNIALKLDIEQRKALRLFLQSLKMRKS
ncbi:hypothetical protein SAMN05444392_102413 [Seinonella peptonophila]|uniref:Uncharacterized protein n=1 Tax=Seinonella peptonophila TaxID=112248 RepID=A0A1M4VLE6_9BACL|nr:hypothetical protein [Seinonella peptonophila]SHE69652.1 hypothetical protein SAMN05444392_102413 [Seinonella peptonophila]